MEFRRVLVRSYTLLAVLLLLLVPEAARARITDGAARLLGGWGILVLPLAAWMAILFAFPGYRETHALFDDGPNHLHYLVPFFTGWLLRVRPDRKSTRLNSSH